MLNLFLRMIYFYSLDFYWSILILSDNILKVIYMYAMPYCSLYMTFNYFKSFFIIEEMKCKICDFILVKHFKMWHSFFNQWYSLLELTYAYFIVIFSPDFLFNHTKHTTLLLQKHILVRKAISSHKIYFFVHHSLKKPYSDLLTSLTRVCSCW
jgi:hypothetical protein